MPMYEPPKGNMTHTELPGRDQPEQHPIDSISGLSEILDAIPRPMTADELRKILLEVEK